MKRMADVYYFSPENKKLVCNSFIADPVVLFTLGFLYSFPTYMILLLLLLFFFTFLARSANLPTALYVLPSVSFSFLFLN